ncbi:unnamed protein product [Euphydryas editha]|uniref:U6 snRNA phosphodiesterase n=1 Tax=Euphydryas editha TaxID=104508 RepID=A0AAU9TZ73_EUPED|nr:unnamed protein product [Euphydryas editha]
MSALNLLRDYGSDDTSDESDKDNSVILKKPKLPTPNLSGVSVVLSEEHVDDPSLHNGRTRTFSHVRGNWATFIYVEYPNKEKLFKIIHKLYTVLTTIDESCIVCEDVHISLSRTFVLKYHMIKSFTTSLQKVLSNIERFDLNFDSVEVYCNEEETRTFLALGVDAIGHGYLINIVKEIDNLLGDFKLPKFYENPSFHMSILSVNGNKKEEISRNLHYLNDIFIHQTNKIVDPVNINKVNCKSGNKVYQYCIK